MVINCICTTNMIVRIYLSPIKKIIKIIKLYFKLDFLNYILLYYIVNNNNNRIFLKLILVYISVIFIIFNK
jgi:hypothetical protein